MMNMKKYLSVFLALALCFALTACGAAPEAGGSEAGTDTAQSAEVTESAENTDSGSAYTTDTLVVNIWDNNQRAGLQQIADEWSETSGVKVKVEVIAWDAYWTLLEAGATGGNLPDVFWMHINEAEKYMASDMLLNLDSYIAADESIDLGNYYEGIVDIYSHDGSQYALPKDHDTIALLYNKGIFDTYGIDYPTDEWTWDDYAATAKAIYEAGQGDGVYGTAMNTNDGQDGWYDLIYSFGGELISEDKKTSGMDNENTLKAMTWLAENLFPYMPPQDIMSTTDPDVLFQSNLVGMMLQGSWMAGAFDTYMKDSGAEYGWAEIPYYDANDNGTCEQEERVSLYNGLGWAVDAKTDDPQAAYDLIAAFCSEAGQLKQSELGVTMAAYKGCSDAFVNAFDDMDLTPFLAVEENGTIVMHPYSRYTTRWESLFTTELVNAWQNPASMEEVCRNIAAQMNEILASE